LNVNPQPYQRLITGWQDARPRELPPRDAKVTQAALPRAALTWINAALCDRWTTYDTEGACTFVEISKRDYLAAKRAPARQLVSIEDVGVATAVLVTDYAKLITGETVYVDAGYHIVG
jgi:NAD(P)-dependent dehydrogenase (short-subunit alcohol dehydrogenase family)